jgi:carbon-monoxide dehydrogenase medium subunit
VCATLDTSCVIQGSGAPRGGAHGERSQGPYEAAVGAAELLIEIRIPLDP